MNSNPNGDTTGIPGQPGIPSQATIRTLIGAGAFCVGLVLLVAGWSGHKPNLLLQGEVGANEIKVVPQVAGALQTWQVGQGEKIQKGQLLVCLENPCLRAKLEQARAAMTSETNQILSVSRLEDLAVQSNWWVKAKAVAEHAQQTLDHSRGLQEAGVISVVELQAIQKDLDLARSSEQAARANFDLALAMSVEVRRLALAAEQGRDAQNVAELEAMVQELKLTSPIDGEVQRHFVEPGDWVNPGSPVASVVDLQNVWVKFKVPENLLSTIRMGSTFGVRVPALGNREVLVRVNYLAAVEGPAPSVRSTKSRDYVRKCFEIRAVPVRATEGLRPGMSVLIDCGRGS